MDEKLEKGSVEEVTEKADLSEIHNKMFDENPDTFTEAEFMNRDYLNHIYGEDMSFLNKEIRQSRIKYYQEKQRLEDEAADKIKGEKKRVFTYSAIFLAVMSPIIVTIIKLIVNYVIYCKTMDIDMQETMIRGSLTSNLIADGFFLAAAWIFFVVVSTVYGIAIYSSVKKIKQWKFGLENALKRLDDSKDENMSMGLYDAE